MWTDFFSPMSIADAKAWLDPNDTDTPTLSDYIRALHGVENKSLHEIHGHLDVSEAIAELQRIEAHTDVDDDRLPPDNRFEDALREIAAGPAATEQGSMTDPIDGAAMVEEITNGLPTSVLDLLELGRAIARLEADGTLTVASLADDFIDPACDLEGVEDDIAPDNPLSVLRAYVGKLAGTD